MADVKSCETCAYIGKSENDYPCNKCTRNALDKWKQMSNADKIRAMSDEELAEFLDNLCLVKADFHCEECNNPLNCDVCYLEWLQSEAE